MKTGIELITKERQEQIMKHGFSVKSDSKHNSEYQLSHAASYLVRPDDDIETFDDRGVMLFRPKDWNLSHWRKMVSKSYKERLIIAGALIVAEIDRLQAVDSNQSINQK